MTFSDKISPINLESFLNMTVVTGHGGKEVVNLDGKLKTVRELVDYWNPQRIQQTIDKLSMGKNKETMEKAGSFDFCRNPQYLNCMVYKDKLLLYYNYNEGNIIYNCIKSDTSSKCVKNKKKKICIKKNTDISNTFTEVEWNSNYKILECYVCL